ncbi:MAG TPA: hypothetical protein VKW06_10380 [Candidatus Angelobacter sp.]|nr:hypothetical protein [Candidatus Angelobacter sp.]
MYLSAKSMPRPRLLYLQPRARLSGLGDDASILAQVFQGQSGSPAAPLVQQTVQTAMSQGQLWTKEDCSGIPASSNLLGVSLSAGGGVAMKLAPLTGPAAPFVLLAGGVMELFGALFGHHAAKVRQEQQIICAVVAACNDTFNTIDQLVQSGQISGQQASQALDALYSQLLQNVQPILKQDSGHCNAACFILAEARGVIGKRKDQYSRMVPANAPPGSYQQSCRNMVVNGDTLSAQCQDTSGNWQQTSLPSIAACAGGEISNINGQLRCCDPNRPAGSTVCNPYSAAGSAAPGSAAPGAPAVVSSIADYVNQISASIGVPAVALWGIGALLLVKLLD